MMDNKDLRTLAERTIERLTGDGPESWAGNPVSREEKVALAEGVTQLLDEIERLTDKLADEILDNEEHQSISEITREHYNPITDGALTDENDEPIV